MGLAFVHGGVHHGGCWDYTIAAIARLDQTIRCLAVDLPGRRGVTGDLATLSIDDCVASVTEQIEEWSAAEGLAKVVLVGHSLAGITMPGVASRLDGGLLDQVIFVACCVPPAGQCVLDTLPLGLKSMAGRILLRSPVIGDVPAAVVRLFFSNAATPAQRRTIAASICPESAALVTETPTGRVPEGVRKGWVVPEHDRALPPKTQRRFMTAMGGVDQVRTIDAGHEVMLTHPEELAAVLVELLCANGNVS